MSFGGSDLTAGNSLSVFVFVMNSSYQHVWSKAFGDVSMHQRARALAVDGSNDVVVTGQFTGGIDFGDGAPLAASGVDAFVAKLGPGGNGSWSLGVSGAGDSGAEAVAVDPSSGDILLTGWLVSTASIGPAELSSAGGDDVFLARLAASGNVIRADRYGDDADQFGTAVASDPDGNVWLAGSFEGSIDFGGGPLVASGLARDAFVVKLSPAP